jgi:hypothetical protein
MWVFVSIDAHPSIKKGGRGEEGRNTILDFSFLESLRDN